MGIPLRPRTRLEYSDRGELAVSQVEPCWRGLTVSISWYNGSFFHVHSEQGALKLGGPERGSRLRAPEQKLRSRARACASSAEARSETRRCGVVIL